jgi:hypothetical protein
LGYKKGNRYSKYCVRVSVCGKRSMGMIESGGVACKCTGSRSYGFREATFHENRIFLSNLRNDSMTPLLRNGLCCTRWPSVAGARTCILRSPHTFLLFLFLFGSIICLAARKRRESFEFYVISDGS